MSSTKSAIGHLLGGAGAVEAIFCILALRDQIVPPTLNLDNPGEGTAGIDLVPHVAKERKVKAVLNNSFGFGGTQRQPGAARGVMTADRHPELDSGSMNTLVGCFQKPCSWMLKQVQHDGEGWA